MLDFNCVVHVSMNQAPPLARSGGVEARYWEGGGRKWDGMTKKKKEKKTKKKKKKNVLSRKRSIQSV